MLIKKLRLQKSWSQEQLADISGLSTRTIQRLERGENASYETLKSLASAFDINVAELSQHYLIDEDLNNPAKHEEPVMQPDTKLTFEEAKAFEKVKEIKAFYVHLAVFLLIIPLLFLLNYLTSPVYYWAWWAVLGWGIGIAIHGITLLFDHFNPLGPDWEKKQVEKQLGRKL